MKFLLNGVVLSIILFILTILSLFIGVSKVSITDIFHLSQEQINIIVSSRIPRTVSILISGSTLALSGLIMQQMMQNKFVSPTTAGTTEWAKLGILISMIFFPQENIIIKLLKEMARQGRTILIVHHDLSKVNKYFDGLILLNKSLIAYGATSDVFTGEHIKRAFGSEILVSSEQGGADNDSAIRE